LKPHYRHNNSVLHTGHLLIAGFGALLVLMITIIWVSISNMKTHQAQLDQVVSDHMTKVGLSLTMRTEARGRTLSLMRLLLINDPFDWDEELMQFRDHAARFIVARNRLMDMSLSQEEQELLDLQGKRTKQAVPIQQEIIRLMEGEQYEQAGMILRDRAIPAQNAVIEVVDQFDKLQRDSAAQARATASGYVAWTQTLVLLLGTIAVALGILIAFTVSRAVRQRGEQDAYLATHDPLTDLPNRALLMDRLQQAIQLCERQQGQLGLLFIDIDHFKQINDTYGHAIGDQALIEICGRIQKHLRKSDTLARLSGDEFVVLLEQVQDADAAQHTAERVVEAFHEPAQLENCTLKISVSVGIALYPEHGETKDELLSHGDTAMYRSKQDGRGRWSLYEGPSPSHG
jgi:diguanylate cyclase (GGDEF)-like protein